MCFGTYNREEPATLIEVGFYRKFIINILFSLEMLLHVKVILCADVLDRLTNKMSFLYKNLQITDMFKKQTTFLIIDYLLFLSISMDFPNTINAE